MRPCTLLTPNCKYEPFSNLILMQHVRQGQPSVVTALQPLGVCLPWDASSANHAPPVRKRVVQLGKEPR